MGKRLADLDYASLPMFLHLFVQVSLEETFLALDTKLVANAYEAVGWEMRTD